MIDIRAKHDPRESSRQQMAGKERVPWNGKKSRVASAGHVSPKLDKQYFTDKNRRRWDKG